MGYLLLMIGILLLSVVFRLASALRLTIPLLYALLTPILLPEWYHTHTALADGVFFVLLGAVGLSWIITLARKLLP